MATRPDKKPRWATVPTVNPTTGKNNVIEPDEGKKDIGWDYLEKPARNFLNWVHNKTYEWLNHLDTSRPFAVRENTVPDMSFIISKGSFRVPSTGLVEIAQQVIGPLTAPSVNPRIDRVVLNTVAGITQVVQGAEAASPVLPSLTADMLPISNILLETTTTSILDEDISEERAYADSVRDATISTKGVLEIATGAELIAGSDNVRAATALGIAGLQATISFSGFSELATAAEAQAKSDSTRVITPNNLGSLDSTESFSGFSERATQAETDAGSDDVRYITPLKLASTTISQGQLNTLLSDVGGVGNLVQTGGYYCFWPNIQQTGGNMTVQVAIASTVTVDTNIINLAGTGSATHAHTRYVAACPPYDWGIGLVHQFVYLLIEKVSGKILAVSSAEEPIWANNGPTKINPMDRISQLLSVDTRIKDINSKVKLDSYINSLEQSNLNRKSLTQKEIHKILSEEPSQEVKNRDMDIIPHPFADYDSTKHIVAMVDPIGKFNETMHNVHRFSGDFWSKIILDGYMTLDNTPINVGRMPKEVVAYGMKFKNNT